jgi:hypothetical protein
MCPYAMILFASWFSVGESQGVRDIPRMGHSEPAHTSALWRMDGKWSENNYLLDFTSLVNHGG